MTDKKINKGKRAGKAQGKPSPLRKVFMFEKPKGTELKDAPVLEASSADSLVALPGSLIFGSRVFTLSISHTDALPVLNEDEVDAYFKGL